MKKLVFISTLLLSAVLRLSAASASFEYGLQFASYPSQIDDVTGVLLDGGNPIVTGSKDFKMEFLLRTRDACLFGGVFRIITDNGGYVDLRYRVEFPVFSVGLVSDDAVTEVTRDIPMNEWIPVRIQLCPKDGSIELKYGSETVTTKSAAVKGAKKYVVSLGKNKLKDFSVNDVPSIDVRDLKIWSGRRQIRDWEFARHKGDLCLDSIVAAEAKVDNPHWIIDKYVTWEELLTLEFPHEPSYAFDADSTFLFASRGRTLYKFNPSDRKLEKLPVSTRFPGNGPDEMLYVGGERPFAVFNPDDNIIALFNPETNAWEGARRPVIEHDYWNKTSCWDPATRRIFHFGGYGHYAYNNELVVVDSLDASSRRSMKLDAIDPRYNVSSCVVDSLMYIFGGRGNKSGQQDLSPHTTFDLYSVNTQTLEVKSLWSLEESPVGVDFLPSSNMLYNPDEDCFYVLSNLDGYTLVKINRVDGSSERMCLPIRHGQKAQYVNRSLYYSPTLGMMYALGCFCKPDGESVLKLYQIPYPPYPRSMVEQENVAGKGEDSSGKTWPWIVLAAALIAAGAVLVWRRLKKGQEKRDASVEKASYETSYISKYYNTSKSSICFFGGFRVKDAQGEDITDLFTPTLKSLVVLLILYSAKNASGIISGKLNNTLWSYKDEDAANNNRNVYMSKLRALLEKVGDVKVTCLNKFWKIEFGEGTFCDYMEAKRLFDSAEMTDEKVERLLEILLRGVMLPNMESDWVDEFKSSFSNKAIDFLSSQLVRKENGDQFVIRVADSILQHDYLNEDALREKCRVLYAQGKSGFAKTCYENFCRDYQKGIGLSYPHSFKEIVEN